MDYDGRAVPVVAGHAYRLEAAESSWPSPPAKIDVAYYVGAEISRVERDVELPYTFTPKGDETHAGYSVGFDDESSGVNLYIG